jgi:MoaE-MoaD fusion protein
VIVKVLFFGVLKEITGVREETASFAEGTSLGDVFAHYAQRFETLNSARSSILFARNREFCPPETVLMQDDEVAFLPPVSGGSGISDGPRLQRGRFSHVIEDATGNMYALTRLELQSQAYAQQLQRGEDGAVVVFEGVVRNNTKGRATRFLEYECYEEMAIEQMARIGREIVQEFEIGRIAIVHRLGRLAVGEASVAVVVTAPHRKPAFEAALAGINRLKREIPIWKKEFFEDGAVWVEGEWDERLPGRVNST